MRRSGSQGCTCLRTRACRSVTGSGERVIEVRPIGRRIRSLLDVFLYILGTDLGAIDIPFGVRGDALGIARDGRAIGGVGDERGHGAIARAADANAALPSRVMAVTFLIGGFGVGHVDHVVAVDVDSAGARELLPFGEKSAVLVENLNAVIGAVADKEAAARIERKGVGHFELAGAGAVPA